jgi:hypothetical protein
MQMTLVASSCSQCSTRSLPVTSALLPMETNWVNPIPRSAAAFRIATPRAPDWAPGSARRWRSWRSRGPS